MAKRFLVFSLSIMLIAGCSKLTTAPYAWFDKPITGSSFPYLATTPIEIVFHGADPSGVKQIEFYVNGILQNTFPNPDGNINLTTMSIGWLPNEPGKYVLQIRTQSIKGQWGNLATTIIESIAGNTPESQTGDFTVSPTLDLIRELTATETYQVVQSTLTPTLTPTPRVLLPTWTQIPTGTATMQDTIQPTETPGFVP